MANIIKPKRTTTPGNDPTTSNLAEGEIAINLADSKLYVRDTSNNILTLAEPIIPAVEAASSISMTGTLTVQNDLTTHDVFGIGNYGGGPFSGTPQHSLEAYAPNQQTNKLLHHMRAPVATNAANPELYIKQNFTGSNGTVNVGEFGWRHMGAGPNTGKDRFEVIHVSDDGLTASPMMSLQQNNAIYLSRTDYTQNTDWRISGGNISHLLPTYMEDVLYCNSLLNTGKIQMSTQAADINSMLDTVSMPNTDTLHNHLRATLDYGANTIPDGAKSSITFSVKSDTESDTIVSRFASSYNTSGNNSLDFEVSDNAGNFTTTSFDTDKMTLGTPLQLYTAGSDPASPSNGWVYYNVNTHKMRLYANGAWVDLN